MDFSVWLLLFYSERVILREELKIPSQFSSSVPACIVNQKKIVGPFNFKTLKTIKKTLVRCPAMAAPSMPQSSGKLAK